MVGIEWMCQEIQDSQNYLHWAFDKTHVIIVPHGLLGGETLKTLIDLCSDVAVIVQAAGILLSWLY